MTNLERILGKTKQILENSKKAEERLEKNIQSLNKREDPETVNLSDQKILDELEADKHALEDLKTYMDETETERNLLNQEIKKEEIERKQISAYSKNFKREGKKFIKAFRKEMSKWTICSECGTVDEAGGATCYECGNELTPYELPVKQRVDKEFV